jgi:hypothetical protein
MTDFFIGSHDYSSHELSNSKVVELGNDKFYNNEKKNGFFIEEFFFNAMNTTDIGSSPYAVVFDSNNQYYILFLNDLKKTNSLVYKKDQIEEEAIQIIIEEFSEDDMTYIVYAKDNGRDVEIKIHDILKNKIINEILIQPKDIEVKRFTSKIDDAKKFGKRYVVSVVILIIGLATNFLYYKYGTIFITNYIEKEYNSIRTINEELNIQLNKKNDLMKKKVNDIQKLNSKTDLMENVPMFMEELNRITFEGEIK